MKWIWALKKQFSSVAMKKHPESLRCRPVVHRGSLERLFSSLAFDIDDIGQLADAVQDQAELSRVFNLNRHIQ